MKTAISVPDSIFQEADELAKRLGISRSELFRKAVEAYIETHKHDMVRKALDEVYAEEPSTLDDTIAKIQWASLPKEDW